MRNLRPLRSSTRVDLLAEPAAHLAAGVAGEQHRDVVLLVELVEHFAAAALDRTSPGSAAGSGRRRPKCRRRRSGPCRNSSRTRCARSRPCRSTRRRTLAAPARFRRRRRSESGTCCRSPRRPPSANTSAAAEQRVERLRPAGRQAPLHFRHRLRDGRRGNRARGGNAETRRPSRIDDVSCLYPPSGFCGLDGLGDRGSPSPADFYPLGHGRNHDGARRLTPVCTGSTKVVSGAGPQKRRQKTSGPALWAGPVHSRRFAADRLYAAADHEVLVGVFGDLPPQVFVVAEGGDRFQHLLVVRVLRRILRRSPRSTPSGRLP